MNKPEDQLARIDEPGVYNLAIGEPAELSDFMTPVLQHIMGKLPHKTMFDRGYPKLTPSAELMRVLKPMYPGKFIVVANGAKQGVMAALYAMQVVNGQYGDVATSVPYWTCYPSMIATMGKGISEPSFNSTPLHSTYLSTVPNNPDGSENMEQCDIVDAVYAHPMYGWSGKLPKNKIEVYSASKVFGVGGLRVGWCVTDDEKLAKAMASYIELYTAGVSNLSQLVVADLMEIHNNPRMEWHHELVTAQNKFVHTMDTNADTLKTALRFMDMICYDGRFDPQKPRGMFGWFKVDDNARFRRALDLAKVRMVDGTSCGASDGWWRVNCGQSIDYTEDACDALLQAWEQTK